MKKIALLIVLAACGSKKEKPAPKTVDAAPVEHVHEAPKVELPPPPPIAPAPLGLESVSLELPSAELAELGRILFFDKRLSSDGSASCETCHRNEHSFADDDRLSIGVGAVSTTRNVPSLVNIGYRGENLEAVVLAEWRKWLGVTDTEKVATAIGKIPEYDAHFHRAAGGPPSTARVAKALAAFVTTIRSGDSAWDRWEARKEPVPELAQRGYAKFSQLCATCHTPPLYTNDAKVPTLRSLAKTGPYLRDGSAKTLADAVKRHPDVKVPAADVAALVRFIETLEADVAVKEPRLPAAGE